MSVPNYTNFRRNMSQGDAMRQFLSIEPYKSEGYLKESKETHYKLVYISISASLPAVQEPDNYDHQSSQ